MLEFRYKLKIEYDGTGLFGWQRQKDLNTVQGNIEYFLNYLLKNPNNYLNKKTKNIHLESAKIDSPLNYFPSSHAPQFPVNDFINVHGASRTDSGVHALSQYAHFDFKGDLNLYRLIKSLNFFLNKQNIAIVDIQKVPNDFHARFSVKSKTYLYRIANRYHFPVLLKNRVWTIKPRLNLDKLLEDSSKIVGKFDFSSFRDSECQSKSSIKTLDAIEVYGDNDSQIELKFKGKSFLHHMIRNIVGTLIYVNLGKLNDISTILSKRDRKYAGPTAPSCGLYLMDIEY